MKKKKKIFCSLDYRRDLLLLHIVYTRVKLIKISEKTNCECHFQGVELKGVVSVRSLRFNFQFSSALKALKGLLEVYQLYSLSIFFYI